MRAVFRNQATVPLQGCGWIPGDDIALLVPARALETTPRQQPLFARATDLVTTRPLSRFKLIRSETTASESPFLIGSAVATPNDHARSVCRATTGSVQAKAADTLNFARAGERPLLVCATVAG